MSSQSQSPETDPSLTSLHLILGWGRINQCVNLITHWLETIHAFCCHSEVQVCGTDQTDGMFGITTAGWKPLILRWFQSPSNLQLQTNATFSFPHRKQPSEALLLTHCARARVYSLRISEEQTAGWWEHWSKVPADVDLNVCLSFTTHTQLGIGPK